MSNRPTAVPGARATLILSLAMTVVGGTGLMQSGTMLTATPADLAQHEGGEDPGEMAFSEANEVIVGAMISSQVMKATFVLNLIASGLLVLAAFMLLGRRRSALWWTQQALTANVVHAIGFVAGAFYFARENEALLAEVAGRLATTQGQTPSGGPAGLGFATGTICSSAFMLAVYAMMLRAARREDVQRFVQRQDE